MLLPEKLQKLAQHPEGEYWLAMLPGLLADLAEQWDLQLGDPYTGANVSSSQQGAHGSQSPMAA
jgi:hypothetical protein